MVKNFKYLKKHLQATKRNVTNNKIKKSLKTPDFTSDAAILAQHAK